MRKRQENDNKKVKIFFLEMVVAICKYNFSSKLDFFSLSENDKSYSQ